MLTCWPTAVTPSASQRSSVSARQSAAASASGSTGSVRGRQVRTGSAGVGSAVLGGGSCGSAPGVDGGVGCGVGPASGLASAVSRVPAKAPSRSVVTSSMWKAPVATRATARAKVAAARRDRLLSPVMPPSSATAGDGRTRSGQTGVVDGGPAAGRGGRRGVNGR